MNKEDFRTKFEEIFDHEMSSIDYAALNNPDYIGWMIDTFFTFFKEPKEIDPRHLVHFAMMINQVRQMRIALGIPA
jgi:hypothetical protein